MGKAVSGMEYGVDRPSERAHGQMVGRLEALEWAALRFADLFEFLPISCFTVDKDLTVMEWNAAASELYGIPAGGAVDASALDTAFAAEDHATVLHYCDRVLAGWAEPIWERTVSQPDESTRTITTRARTMRRRGGEPFGIMFMDVDVTEERNLARLLSENEKFQRQVMTSVPDMVYTFDLVERRHVYRNRTFRSYYGYRDEAEDFTGVELRALIHPDDLASMEAHFRLMSHLTDGAVVTCESRILHGDGTWHHMQSNDSVFERDSNGQVRLILGCLRDVTHERRMKSELQQQFEIVQTTMCQLRTKSSELERANLQLKKLAATDPLTGVNNYRAFQSALDSVIAKEGEHSLLIIDVDSFKEFNDSFGHMEGDSALRSVAQILTDVSPPGSVVARYGGEEFVVLLPFTGADQAVRFAEELRAQAEARPWLLRPVTVSVGVATTSGAMTRDEIVKAADAAMYQSKLAGRNRVTHAREGSNESSAA